MRINELINEGRAQEIVHKNPTVGTLKALAKNNKYGSVRFVIYKDGTLVAADSEHFTHHSMAPAMGAWEVRGYVQHLGNNDYAYRSMNVYDPMTKDHPIFRKWERMGVENGNDNESLDENFADGKGPGRPGDSQRHGIPKKASMAQLEKSAKAKGRKGQLARWQLNMRRGKKKVNEEKYTVDRNGIQLSVSIDGATVEVRPMHDNKQLGYVVFDRDGKTLVADDLSIDDEYRGKGIAKIIYDYIKELGFIIKRSSDQTSSGKKYWDKHAGEKGQLWEVESSDNRKQAIAEFVKFALAQLKCEHRPKIKLVTDNQQVQNYKSFGGTNIQNGEIWVYIQNRNLADLLRTLCHELVHYKQFKDGRIKGPEDGKTGSELENEANSQAGIILRHYGKMNPSIFESK